MTRPTRSLCVAPEHRYVRNESSDPTAIRSLAVTTADVVAALETNLTTGRRAVLRVTPPFSGRMRARLHLDQGVDGEHSETTASPIHIDPARLVADPPAYPRAVETEAALRRDPAESYTVDRHHERHAEAVEQWRQRVPERIRDRIALETPGGSHDVAIQTLERDL